MTISVSGDYVVAANQTLSFPLAPSTAAYVMGAGTFTDFGSIQISSSDANATILAIDTDTNLYTAGLVKIAAGGQLSLSATGSGSAAYGFDAYPYQGPFENDGVFSVSAVHSAIGVEDYDLLSVVNTGSFTVSADQAKGIDTYYSGTVVNSGTLTITGGSSAIAVDMTQFMGGSLGGSVTNSGVITATASSGTAYGILVGGLDMAFNLVNTGTITAQYAIYEVSVDSPPETPRLHLQNSGTINGDIVLGIGPAYGGQGAQIYNTGAIHGVVNLDQNGADLYDGRGGTLTGKVVGGQGADVIFLGDDGEYADASTTQSAALIGGSGADTLIGGAGADVLVSGGGDDTLQGGAGADIFAINIAAGAAVITDFSHAQGDLINLAALGTITDIAGVRAAAVQSGADTVISTGSGTLTLKNVQLSSLTNADFVFYQPMSEYSGTFTVAAGQNLYVSPFWVNAIAYWLDTGASFVCNGFLLVETSGALWNAGWHPYVVGLEVNYNGHVTIGSGGDLTVASPGSGVWAYGMEGQGTGQVILNQGVLSVSGDIVALGATSIDGSFDNQGYIRVNSAHGDAEAVSINQNDPITNEGQVLVTGETSARGFYASSGGANFTNSGTVTAIAHAGTSYGMEFDGSPTSQYIDNSGTLTADVAIAGGTAVFGNQGWLHLTLLNGTNAVINGAIQLGVGALWFTNDGVINGGISTGLDGAMVPSVGVQFTNRGVINGDIAIGDGVGNTFVNSGAIHGALHFTGTHSLSFDGRGGTISGGVYFSDGGGVAYLGAEGEAFHGGAGADVIYSGAGDDAIDGGGGVNTLSYLDANGGVTVNLAATGAQNTGGDGTDTLAHIQNVTGTYYNDVLTGDANDNVIGNGGGGDDVLDGGGGVNTVSFFYSPNGVNVSLALQGQVQNTGDGADTLYNFRNLNGSAYNDTLEGDGADNVLDGSAGINTLTYAHAGAGVTVSLALAYQPQNTGGAGTDTISLFQNLTGSAFNDTLEGDGSDNILDGGAGTNTVSYAHAAAGVTVSLALQGQAQYNYGAGSDTLYNFQNLIGSAYNDTLEGDGGDNVLNGSAGTNTVSYAHAAAGVTVSLALQGQSQNTGGAGADTLSNFQNLTGSAFNDTLEGNASTNVLDGGAGTNTVSYAHFSQGVTVSLSMQGQYQIIGPKSDDLVHFQNLTGSAFNDTLEGDTNNNVLDGGAGTNTITYAHAAAGVTVSLALQGQSQNTVGSGVDTLSNFQNLIGSAFNDVLEGDGNDNVLNGSTGTNTVSYAHAASGVTVSLTLQGQSQNTGGAGSDTLSNFQNLTGSAFGDTLEGNASNNVLDGGGGTNTVTYAHAASGVTVSLALQGQSQSTGGSGSDTLSNFQNLIGSAFNDSLEGDGNNNVIDGGAGINTISYAHAASGVTVSLALQGAAQSTGGSGSDTLSHFQNMLGSAFADHLTGDAGANIIDGGGGDDTLDGGGGVNTLSFASATTGVRVSLALQGSAQTTGVGSDTLTNFQNITGSAFNDTLEGDGHDNVLDGGAGSNTVSYVHAASGVTVSLALQGSAQNTGGAGSDTLSNFQSLVGSAYGDTLTSAATSSTLTGGGGADTFRITSGATATVITDFSHAQGDKIDLTALSQFTSLSGVMAAAVQSGLNTVIHTGSGSLTLDNVTAANLTAADFQFAASSTTNPPPGALPYPYGSVCFVSDVIDGIAYRGSGVIIGPHTILTAAHMVWDADSQQSATQVEISPGIGAYPQTSIPGVAIHYNPVNDANDLLAQSQSQSDFAVIEVAQNLDAYGLFQIDPDFAGGPGSITGYPAANGYLQQNGTGLLTLDPSYHLIDYTSGFGVSPGSSGGPIWINEGTSSNPLPYVVGVVSTDGWGAQITSADLAQIEGWVAQDTGLFNDTPGDITGSVFNDHLIGDAGDNIISGLGGDDVLTGGLGADTFVFGPGGGTDIITDFSHAQGDKIDLSAFGSFQSLGDILAVASQQGADTVLALGSGSVRLQNVAMSSLTAADFGLGGTSTPSNETLNGTAGSDWLQGGSGNDTLHGGGGSDDLDGGPGLNTAAYDGVYRQYTVGSGGTIVSGGPEGGTDDLTNIQRLQFVDGYLAVSPTDTAGQVYRLYEATLGRAPDQDGLVYWTDALNSGATLQSAASGFVNSAEFQSTYGNLNNSDFVTLIYENVLHRGPDAGGLSYWTNLLNTGQDSRAQVVTGFSESAEDITDLAAPIQQGLWIGNADAAEVARLYDSVFSRLPDASGEAYWTNALESGVSLQSAANGFVNSQEFQSTYGALNNSNFVTQIYENVLHRAPDSGGLSYWVGQLNSGATRAQVVVGFSESNEHVTNTAPHIDDGVWVTG